MPRAAPKDFLSTSSIPSHIDTQFLKQMVDYRAPHPPGTVVVDPHRRFLYLVQKGSKAIRYGVGVGREGAPEVRKVGVDVVDRLDPGLRLAGEERRERAGERLDVAAHVPERLPDQGGGARLSAEPRERSSKNGHAGSPPAAGFGATSPKSPGSAFFVDRFAAVVCRANTRIERTTSVSGRP